MNTIVDGRAIAQNIKADIQVKIAKQQLSLRLDIIVVGDNTVTNTFVSAKERFANDVGITFVKKEFLEEVTTEDIVAYIQNTAVDTDGIVVQLPLPQHIDTQRILSAIPPQKDVDVLNEETLIAFLQNKIQFIPPVAGAVVEILHTHNVGVRNKEVVVIGKGKLVGSPVKRVLEKEGAHIQILDTQTSNEECARLLKNADIVISGTGVPNLLTPDMVKEGVVLIDAGTSNTTGSLEGDISKDCASVASVFSQTPGGVGPITVAVLFQNVFKTAVSS